MNFESQPEHSGNSFLRKKFKELPIFFPSDYKNSNALGVVRSYKLHIGQRIFMTFKDQRGSKLGMLIRMLTKISIILNAFAYVWSWSPVNMEQPSTCSNPACHDDPLLCPNSMTCEPVLDWSMLQIQIFCMLVLLANFVIPTCFCWNVPARLAGVLDLSDEVQKAEDQAQECNDDGDDHKAMRKRSSSTARNVKKYFGISDGTSGMSTADIDKMDSGLIDDPKYSVFKQVCRYTTTGRSLRAIIGNVPLFLAFLTVSNLTGNHGLLVYIARMLTLVQLVDFISGKKSGQVTKRTLARAYPTMLFMIWCIFLLAVVVGAIVFLLERGEFTVNEEFPDGAFLRPTVTGRGQEESPFTSMALSLYWVVVTVTSVGYGEMVCTSAYGRLIAVMLMILSIFVLALPIAVIGQILTEEMENYVERKAQKETRVAKQIGIDQSSDLLKKYSTTIERRKSQFNFELPNELKAAADQRRNKMLEKIQSANDSLQREVSFEVSKSPSEVNNSTAISFEKSPSSSAVRNSTGASQLFQSFDDDEVFDDDDDDDGNDEDDAADHTKSNGIVKFGKAKPPVEVVLGDSTSSSKRKKTPTKVESKWNAVVDSSDKDNHSSLKKSSSDRSPASNNHNRKNPILRPTTAKKMNSHGRGTLMRSASSRIRDIDKELRILESNYARQMQQCMELHYQIVTLMREKNESLNEALL